MSIFRRKKIVEKFCIKCGVPMYGNQMTECMYRDAYGGHIFMKPGFKKNL